MTTLETRERWHIVHKTTGLLEVMPASQAIPYIRETGLNNGLIFFGVTFATEREARVMLDSVNEYAIWRQLVQVKPEPSDGST